MGMLFNSDGTNRILNTLNARFRKDRFADLQAHTPTGLITALNSLTGHVPPHGIYDTVCSLLRMDDWESRVSGNWQTFLGILDGTSIGAGFSGYTAPYTVSGEIGRAIAYAIQNQAPWTGIMSVEFFAVPTATTKPSLNIQTVTDHSGEVTMVISVTTTTYDKVTTT